MAQPTVLIIGRDARTDAIAAACAASPCDPVLYALTDLPIPGLLDKCQRVFLGSLKDHDDLISVAREIKPDLAIVGPEEPLSLGFVDALATLDIPAFGPTQRLAAIESSKTWARSLIESYDIGGNPRYRSFTDTTGIERYMQDLSQFVIKPNGLTGGKGVRVYGEHLMSIGDAMAYAERVLSEQGTVLVEEKLEGEEFSLQTITDGDSVIHLPLVQDHKRAFDGDSGPNTGGMGSYSCPDFSLPFLDESDVLAARRTNERVIEALAKDTGELYRGVLYGGFMATRDGIRVVEYNARFGDPEAMNVLPILEADFVELCSAAATGRLGTTTWKFAARATVCKYVVPAAYPDSGQHHDDTIELPCEMLSQPDLAWYWAACEQRNGSAFLTSSRAGAFVGIGKTLSDAEEIAEKAARSVRGLVRHRKDIGTAKVIEARVRHMKSLRS